MNLFWFRRDLRIEDNAGLYHALKSGPTQCMFIFDETILSKLDDKHDPRVEFIHQEITKINEQLQEYGASLKVYHGDPIEIWKDLSNQNKLKSVFFNRDYEPSAIKRDQKVYDILKERKISCKAFKDQVIFDRKEIMKSDGTPYKVFTPYSKTWRDKLNDFYLKSYPTEKYLSKLLKNEDSILPSLNDIGFEKTDLDFPNRKWSKENLEDYKKNRDYPWKNGTSKLSLHLRFGTISIRTLARDMIDISDTFISELIWRDFYQMVIYHFPESEEMAIKEKYRRIEWRNNEEDFEKWCQGKTGYPIVDAGMRELNETGYMHNRVRMVVASFLCKHLLIDWKWGERYFAKKLLDYDLAANVGGWQWAFGGGLDAAPYFRIFNPTSQQEKFDKDLKYIKKWVPEYETSKYPEPIVDHKKARERCLEVFKEALN